MTDNGHLDAAQRTALMAGGTTDGNQPPPADPTDPGPEASVTSHPSGQVTTEANAILARLRAETYSWAEYEELPPAQWLVNGVLPLGGLGFVVAPFSGGKTQIALDLAASIALGLESWQGHRIEKTGTVVWLVLEGQGGMIGRLRAWREVNEIAEPVPNFHLLRTSTNLLDPAERLALLTRIQELGADLVVVDTLSQSIPGADENGSSDMSATVGWVNDVRAATGAGALFCAHTGKDIERGLRGWSGLGGAADVMLEVRNNGKGSIAVRPSKSKDGPTDWIARFESVPYELGVDDDGTPITAIAVRPDMTTPVADNSPVENTDVRRAVAINQLVLLDMGRGVRHTDWRDALISSEAYANSGTEKGRSSAAKRDIKDLFVDGYVEQVGPPPAEGKSDRRPYRATQRGLEYRDRIQQGTHAYGEDDPIGF